ncbi:hypothetical protein QF040_006586 [Variovorax sp. W2I14]
MPFGKGMIAAMPEDIIAPPTVAETPEAAPALPLSPPADPHAAPHASLLHWIAAGLRTAFLQPPRIEAGPAPWQLLLLVLLPELVWLGLGRFEVRGPVELSPTVALYQFWMWGALAWLGWGALQGRPGRLARWLVLATWASFPVNLLFMSLTLALAYGWSPAFLKSTTNVWLVYGVGYAWMLIAITRLTVREAVVRWRIALFVPGLVVLMALGFWQSLNMQERVWHVDYAAAAAAQPQRPTLELTQEVFEQQQALWEHTVAGLGERQPGQVNVYGLVFAPYAAEDVFLRESTMVAKLLEERFDAKQRVLHLANHATTAGTLPWATPLNLQRAIAALGQRMDRENDLLVVYLTSHGAHDHQLAATNGVLTVPWLTPEDLRKALDDAGIRHRVLAISACYSGGWIEPLASDDTLLMTAADATHTSYGCGRLSELTFFGRAMFDEELRKTHSFETAFAAAVPVIKQREIDAGKDDGFSNPQISVGEKIRPVLDQLALRLDAAGK